MAISEVLRAIASSSHDLQPIFKPSSTAQHACAEQRGAPSVLWRKLAFVSLRLPPMLLEHGSFIGRLVASKSSLRIPDLAAHEVYRAGDAGLVALVKGAYGRPSSCRCSETTSQSDRLVLGAGA